MLRARRLLVLLALVAAFAAIGVLAGCGDGDETEASPSAAADATSQAYTIGISQFVTHPALDASTQGFQDALAEKGFTNITYDLQNAQADIATAASIAQKFAGDDLDLVYAVATPSAQAVAKAITTTPIVFAAVTDPVGAGLVEDPTAPGANVTGVSDLQPVEPILKLAQTFNPAAKNVGMVYNAGESNSVYLVEQAEETAKQMGLTIVKATAGATSEVQAAAESLVGRVDAIMVIGDNTAVTALESIVKVCEQNGIPLLAGDPDSVERGAAAGYGFDYYEIGKAAGYQAAELLGGAAVGDVAVQYAKDFPASLQLSVNLKHAKAQGVTLGDLVDEAVNQF